LVDERASPFILVKTFILIDAFYSIKEGGRRTVFMKEHMEKMKNIILGIYCFFGLT
jgi:hypothetical protein